MVIAEFLQLSVNYSNNSSRFLILSPQNYVIKPVYFLYVYGIQDVELVSTALGKSPKACLFFIPSCRHIVELGAVCSVVCSVRLRYLIHASLPAALGELSKQDNYVLVSSMSREKQARG